MARPTEKQRDVAVQVTLSKEEKERLEWAASEVGLSVASLLRMTGLKFAKETIG